MDGWMDGWKEGTSEPIKKGRKWLGDTWFG